MTYWKVGTTYRDTIVYLSGGAAVTGLTSAAFTFELSKNGTGNQSTTGVTLTEVDAVNNAGEYVIEVNGSTGFVASTGFYDLVVYRTAIPTDRWTIPIRVTADGTGGTSSATTAAWVPTASDGRVTDGSSPLEDATIFFKTSAGKLVTSVTTNASGLHDTVYLTESVTAFVQKSGYTQTSYSITVSGGTATGPGADATISAIVSSTSMTASEMWSYAKRVARNVSGALTDQIVKELVNDALDDVSKSAYWSWYLTLSSEPLELNGAYSTGTIAVTDGGATVTLTGGTWPTWAGNGNTEIRIAGRFYKVASRTSGTEIELTANWHGDNLTAQTYTIYQDRYDLPANLLKFGQPLYGRSWPWGDEEVSFLDVLEMKNVSYVSQQTPYVHTVHNGDLLLWPAPESDQLIPYSYYRRPAPLVSSSDNVDWDPAHKDLLHRAIDLHVALRYGETAGGQSYDDCEEIYKRALAKANPNQRRPMRRTAPLARGGNRNVRIPDNA